MKTVHNLLLAIARVTLAAWVGAAGLFVVTSVDEQRQPGFTTETKYALARLRFPYYYGFGFTLVGAACTCGWVARTHPQLPARRVRFALGLLVIAFTAMLVDYLWIYRALDQMIRLPQPVDPTRFAAYHSASKYVNAFDVGLCVVAAVLFCWPDQGSRKPCLHSE